MSSKKRIAAVAITIAALTGGSVAVASAHDGAGKGQAKATALADLVKAGTITQAQADAISKKFDDFKATMDANKAAHKTEHDARHAAREALVVSTLHASTARTPLTLFAAICSPFPEPPKTIPSEDGSATVAIAAGMQKSG